MSGNLAWRFIERPFQTAQRPELESGGYGGGLLAKLFPILSNFSLEAGIHC